MTQTVNLSRREFLQHSMASGAALILGFSLPSEIRDDLGNRILQEQETFAPNAFLRIDTDGVVTVTVHRTEMGQGVQTALPMIVADELEADWSMIRTIQAPPDPIYGGQNTGGSASIRGSFQKLREAGATAREMLISAAAQTWQVDRSICIAQNGKVSRNDNGQSLPYGELVGVASTLDAPAEVPLKSPADFRIIGTRKGHVDNPEFVTGSTTFASDVVLPEMLYAVTARNPLIHSNLQNFDATAALEIHDVVDVIRVGGNAVVLANSTWAAIKGRDALTLTLNEGNSWVNSDLVSEIHANQLEDMLSDIRNEGPDQLTYIEAQYQLPYLAHGPMEPMNCVADVRNDSCEVWAPTQDREGALRTAVSRSGLPESAVTIHVPRVGGGFGRRLNSDYVSEAVQISKAVGKPVKLLWTRDEDIQKGTFRPASTHVMRGGLDNNGTPITWQHYIVGQDSESSMMSQATDLVFYQVIKEVKARRVDLPVPTSAWRAVFNTQNAFVNESFIDELAAAANRDPYEFRMELLDNDRVKAVLELAATKADWGSPLPDGWGRGIALHATWGVSPVAQVAEVSVDDSGHVRVHRVVCAVDCGIAINPDNIEAQMEGGIIFGLTAALKGEITIKDGRVQQSNFHNYPLLRIDETPIIEVHMVESTAHPTGIGEMGNPPIAPAVANAIFDATGIRVRKQPIRPEDLRRA